MSQYDNLDITKVDNVKSHIEDNSKVVDKIVEDIVKPYSDDLDYYVNWIKQCLKDGTRPILTTELEDCCLNLSTYIYFAGGMCENLGIRDDISKAVYKETYNSAHATASGTVPDKNAIAELNSQQEQIVNVCFNRAYKIMKAKVDAAQELLSSCKKVLSHRIQEEQLTHMLGGE